MSLVGHSNHVHVWLTLSKFVLGGENKFAAEYSKPIIQNFLSKKKYFRTCSISFYSYPEDRVYGTHHFGGNIGSELKLRRRLGLELSLARHSTTKF
jgi:hypothetical protein